MLNLEKLLDKSKARKHKQMSSEEKTIELIEKLNEMIEIGNKAEERRIKRWGF